MKAISVTELRTNAYQIIDSILKTGKPVEINRQGRKLKIILENNKLGAKKGKFARLEHHPDATTGNDEDFVHMDWSREWKP